VIHMAQRKIAPVRCVVAAVLLLFMRMAICSPALAQPLRQWSPDERIPGYLDETFTPYLLADQNRTVHAFANQLVGDPNPQLAILYRQWSLESGWTTAVDILLAPAGGDAQIVGAFLDQQGIMHVMFWGGEPQAANIYYARAPATDAGRALAWSPVKLIGQGALSPIAGALAGDMHGNLVIIYSGNIAGNGVYASYSSTAGESWSEPTPLFLTYDAKLSPFSLHAYMDPDSRLHVVWNVVTDVGVDMAAYYTRFDVMSQQWGDPVVLEEKNENPGFFGPSFPTIIGYSNTLVVMYNSGNPTVGGPVDVGRPVQRVRLSKDGGDTWEDAINAFPRHLGRSGEHSLVVDSDQAVHALFMQRIEVTVDSKYTVIDGPWHSLLREGQWSEPARFPAKLAPADVRSVISQGNVLLVTWREDPGVGQEGVWYSYTTLNAPELPVIPIPTVVATATVSTQKDVTSVLPNPTPTLTRLAVPARKITPETQRSPAGPLIFATAPVLLLFAGLIFVRRWVRRRNQ
jgi:hypothetical protein